MYRKRYNPSMPASKRLDAIFFRSKVGNELVRERLKGLAKEQRKAIGEDIALRSIQMADRQAACRSPARGSVGSSVVAGQSDRTNVVRGRRWADDIASRVHQEN